MRTKTAYGFVMILLVVGLWLTSGCSDRNSQRVPSGDTALNSDDYTGPMNFGRFVGQVVYDEEEERYFLELRGARFPFRTSPLEAQHVKLDAPGKSPLEKNTALIYAILGSDVSHATLLVDPDEENEVMPAVNDIAQAIQMVNPRKFAGLAYTKPGGQLQRSVAKGSQIQSFEDATTKTPLIYLKGPGSGGSQTEISVMDGGRIVVEGETYEDLYLAADYIYLTLIKMLCGSPECPDAAACLSGGDCGCG